VICGLYLHYDPPPEGQGKALSMESVLRKARAKNGYYAWKSHNSSISVKPSIVYESSNPLKPSGSYMHQLL
jgi:hypothetical protein